MQTPDGRRFSVNRRSFVPLYHQLEDYLYTRIRDGELKPGDRLPSESELAETFGISRITVRQAMARLQFEGLVDRRRGQGTFVSRTKLVQRTGLQLGFEEEILAQGKTPGLQFIDFARVEDPPPTVRSRLRLGADEPAYRLERLRLVDGEPVGIEIRFFPERIGAAFGIADVEHLSIYPLLKTVLGNHPRHLVETISCSVTWEDEALKLHLPVGSPVLIREHVMFDDSDTPVEHGKSIFRGDRYQMQQEFWRDR